VVAPRGQCWGLVRIFVCVPAVRDIRPVLHPAGRPVPALSAGYLHNQSGCPGRHCVGGGLDLGPEHGDRGSGSRTPPVTIVAWKGTGGPVQETKECES
jgi:hypothetical protein